MLKVIFVLRFGTALAFDAPGEINLRKAVYEDDFSPIDPTCPCSTCRDYTRAYLHTIVTKAGIVMGSLNYNSNTADLLS